MVPVADSHICDPPRTTDLPRALGAILFDCPCGRRWHIEHFYSERNGGISGSNWILFRP